MVPPLVPPPKAIRVFRAHVIIYIVASEEVLMPGWAPQAYSNIEDYLTDLNAC